MDSEEEEEISDFDEEDGEFTISEFDDFDYQNLQDDIDSESDEEGEEETEDFIVIYAMVPIRGACYFAPHSVGPHNICICLNFIKQPFKELKNIVV